MTYGTIILALEDSCMIRQVFASGAPFEPSSI